MENYSSPLDTLRQLKEMLDAGALTPAEFDALKQRLLFNSGSATDAATPPAAPPAVPPLTSTWLDTPPEPVITVQPAAAPVPPVTPAPTPSATAVPPVLFEDVAAVGPSRPSALPGDSGADLPPVSPEAFATAAAAPNPRAGIESDAFGEFEEPAAPSNNSLALVLSIGGVLAFLAVVLYLSLNRPPSEHLSSTSQTAADSVQTAIDEGPQAVQPPAPASVPETVRVAPAHPAPVVVPRPTTPPRTDSAVQAPAPVASDSVAP